MKLKRSTGIRIRWLQRPDLLPAFRLIAGQGVVSHETLAACLESPDTVGLVAERRGQLVGLLVYRVVRELNEVAVLGAWVDPEWRRQGVASALLRRVKQKAVQNYHLVSAAVPADRVECQLFLQSQGFCAAAVLPSDAGAVVMELGLTAGTTRTA